MKTDIEILFEKLQIQYPSESSKKFFEEEMKEKNGFVKAALEAMKEVRQIATNENWKEQLFDYMKQEFGLVVLVSEMNEIRRIIIGDEQYLQEANDTYKKNVI